MTIKGGTSQACAVCKYQRRRCTDDCLLAPYFPADQPKVFQNTHRLFGVSNIMKILREVPPDQREEAMKSIKYESFIRSKFPVHGCLEVICHLKYQLQQAMEELWHVYSKLAVIKGQYGIETSQKSDFRVDSFTFRHYLDYNAPPFSGNEFGGYNGNFVFPAEGEEMKPFIRAQTEQFLNYNHNINLMMVKQETGVPQESLVHREIEVLPFDNITEDGQSFIASKEACESSAESTLKDEFVMENDLKSAAACFSLTSLK